MIEPVQAMQVTLKDNFIIFSYQGSDNITYQAQKNLFKEKTGLTIENVGSDVPAYGLLLNQFGSELVCGHIIDNVIGYLKGAELENIVLIIDFDGITNISKSFCEQYFKFLLTTKSKVISINQDINIIIAFSKYVNSMIDYQDDVK